VSAGRIWREVRTLLATRQLALGYLIALAALGTALDLGASAVRHRFHSFSAFARAEFDSRELWRAVGSLEHAPIAITLLIGVSLLLFALLQGWLQSCYLRALGDGVYSLRAARRTVLRLSGFLLAFDLIGLGLVGLADNGLLAIALPLQLALIPFVLYADYAIVFDDVGPVEGVRRSLRVVRARLRASILSAIGLLFATQIAAIAFATGFTDSTHVQPTYLVAWLLVLVLLDFASDALLITIYRDTRLSADGSGGPPAPSHPPEASDSAP
jgi:hypothetical protein